MSMKKKRTLDVQTVVCLRWKNDSRWTAGRRCFCFGDTKISSVPPESESMTECIVSSLNMTGSENVISLLQNYISDEFLAFGSVSLQALVAFLVSTKNSEPQKFHVKKVLDDQLRYHPACAPYMSQTYNALMLTKSEHFFHLTALDYVLSTLEQMLSHGKVRITDHRPVRRCSQPKSFFDNSVPKTNEDAEPARNAGVDVDDVCWALDFLVQILKHDFGINFRQRNKITYSIMVKLAFEFDGMLQRNAKLLRKIFQVYKMYCPSDLRRVICDLVSLIADLCVLIEGYVEFDFYELNPACREFVDEFCGIVVNDAFSSQTFSIVTQLRPEWLRFHVAHHVIETQICEGKKIPIAVEGVICSLHYLKKSKKRLIKPRSNTVQNTEEPESSKIQISKNLTTNEPASILWKLIVVYIDSSLKIDKITKITNCSITMNHSSKLLSILDELNESGNVSRDLKDLRVLLSNIIRT